MLVKKDEGHKQIRSPLLGRLVSTQLTRGDTFAMTPTMDSALAEIIANLARERSSAHSWPEEEKHNDIGALAARRVGLGSQLLGG